MLGRNMVCPGGNAQPRGGYRGGLYGGRKGQITWRIEKGYKEKEEGNTFNRERTQIGPRRDLNTIDIDRGKRGDRMCYVYRK